MFQSILTRLCRKTSVPLLTDTCNPRFLLQTHSLLEYISSQVPSGFHPSISQCINEYYHSPEQDGEYVYVTVLVHSDVIPTGPHICFPEFLDICTKLAVYPAPTPVSDDDDIVSKYQLWSSGDRLHVPIYNSHTDISYTASGYIWYGEPITPPHIHNTQFEFPGHIMTYPEHTESTHVLNTIVTFIQSTSRRKNQRRIFDGRRHSNASVFIIRPITVSQWKQMFNMVGLRVRTLTCKKDFRWLQQDLVHTDILLVSDNLFKQPTLFRHDVNITGGMYRLLLTLEFEHIIYENGRSLPFTQKGIHKNVMLAKQLFVGQYTLILETGNDVLGQSFVDTCIYLIGCYRNSIPLTPEPESIYDFSPSSQNPFLNNSSSILSRIRNSILLDRVVRMKI